MKGKQVIITGPTSGIGKEIAIGLGALGADLVLGCRDVARGKQTADEITRRSGAEFGRGSRTLSSRAAGTHGAAPPKIGAHERARRGHGGVAGE